MAQSTACNVQKKKGVTSRMDRYTVSKDLAGTRTQMRI